MSWAEDRKLLGRWAATRLHPGLFLPIAVALVAASALATPRLWPLLAAMVPLAFAWLVALRLADDIADRDHDRPRHRERVLVAAPSTRPFVQAALLLGAAGVAAAHLLLGPRVALGAAALFAGMVVFYRLSAALRLPRLGHVHLVLLKYPAMIHLLAGAEPAIGPERWRGLAGAYLAATVWELAEDAELRRLPLAKPLLALEIAALLALVVGRAREVLL